MGVSGVPDIREPGPTGYPGYLTDIRDIRNQDQGWGYQVPSLISLIQHRPIPSSVVSCLQHIRVAVVFRDVCALALQYHLELFEGS